MGGDLKIKKIDKLDYTLYSNILEEEKHISKKELIFGIITSSITNIILLLAILQIISSKITAKYFFFIKYFTTF